MVAGEIRRELKTDGNESGVVDRNLYISQRDSVETFLSGLLGGAIDVAHAELKEASVVGR